MELEIEAPATFTSLPEGVVGEIWRTITNFNLPFGIGYLQYKFGWSESLSVKAISEYKKFLLLAKIGFEEVVPSESINKIWCLHILHTKAYQNFSREIGGYIHHIPNLTYGGTYFQGQYEKTLKYYYAVFKFSAPSSIWPRYQNDYSVSELT